MGLYNLPKLEYPKPLGQLVDPLIPLQDHRYNQRIALAVVVPLAARLAAAVVLVVHHTAVAMAVHPVAVALAVHPYKEVLALVLPSTEQLAVAELVSLTEQLAVAALAG